MAETVVTEETVARLLLYRFLARGYTYPDPALLEVLLTDEVWDEMQAADETLSLRAGQTIVDMRAFVSQYAGDSETLLTDLQIEHTYLFINAVPRVPAPPYESAYAGQGRLMGEPVSQVLQTYREAGLDMRQDYEALPDHIAAEAEFMSYLVQQAAEASQSGDGEVAEIWQARQRAFLAEHLLRWGPPFLAKVATSARQPFYRLLATVTETFLYAEARRLGVTACTRSLHSRRRTWQRQCS